MTETEDGPGDRDEDGGFGNPYAMAMGLTHTASLYCDPPRAAAACRLLIAAYAKDPGHVDWCDVQEALEEAMAAFGLSVYEDGSSLVLAPPRPPGGRRLPKPGPAGAQRVSSVFSRDGEWWFHDETGLESGPFGDAADAHLALALNLEFLKHGPVKIWERIDGRLKRLAANKKEG